MSGLMIDSEACIGCGRCVRACASGGIVVEGERPNRCARVTDGCILCGGCVDACPVNAISGVVKKPYTIDPNKCIKCGACKDNCAFDAIYVEA